MDSAPYRRGVARALAVLAVREPHGDTLKLSLDDRGHYERAQFELCLGCGWGVDSGRCQCERNRSALP